MDNLLISGDIKRQKRKGDIVSFSIPLTFLIEYGFKIDDKSVQIPSVFRKRTDSKGIEMIPINIDDILSENNIEEPKQKKVKQ